MRFFWGSIQKPQGKELLGYGLMGLTSALTVPVSYLLVREHIATVLGLPAAGYWQGIWKLSEVYLMLVTTTLSVYYLPRIAEIKTAPELRAEILKVYRFILPLVVLGATVIYLLRDFIIETLFTAAFLPMRELFGWQMIGDVIKIGAWILGFVMLGRAMVRVFIFTEIAFSISFVAFSWLLVDAYGLRGVAMAYALNYTLYWIAMALLIRREIRGMPNEI